MLNVLQGLRLQPVHFHAALQLLQDHIVILKQGVNLLQDLVAVHKDSLLYRFLLSLQLLHTKVGPQVGQSLCLYLPPDFIQLMFFLVDLDFRLLDLPQHVSVVLFELRALLRQLFVFFQNPFIFPLGRQVLRLKPCIALPHSLQLNFRVT